MWQINELAWAFFTRPESVARAEAYLRGQRGIDVTALRAEVGQAVAGYAPPEWRALTEQLRDRGASDTELVDADLAQRTRRGTLVDTYLGRLILPVRDNDENIRLP